MKTFKTILFWVLSCTWGILMTLLGLITALGLIIAGQKPKKFGYGFYFEVGHNWGGLEMGPVFLCQKNAPLSLKQHEAGHGIQNIWFGPLMPFLISIPSAIRYWLRETCLHKDQEAKYRWSLRLLEVPSFLGFILVVLGAFAKVSSIGLVSFIIGIAIVIYSAILLIWLTEFEIPAYAQVTPDYDSIWFEGQASKIGQKRWPEQVKPTYELQN